MKTDQNFGPMFHLVPGASDIAPVTGLAQMNAWKVQPFFMDFAAAPVPPLIVPVTSTSVSLEGQVLGDTVVSVMPVAVVVPVPFHLTVPVVEPIVLLKVPLPPVFAGSVQPESLPFTAPVELTDPPNFEHDTPVAGDAADAVPERTRVPPIGNVSIAAARIHRRIKTPCVCCGSLWPQTHLKVVLRRGAVKGRRVMHHSDPRPAIMETMKNPSRLLPLVGAYNFRDLGGYATTDGRRTRWGRLYRSDTLHELTDDDLELLRDIGLVSVIDLRTSTELGRTGRGVLGSEPLRYVNLSVLPEEGDERQAAPATRIVDVPARYLSYLEVGKSALVESFRLMADPDHYPLVFHCQAGKDRTGVLAALVLSCLDVERRAIVDDYVLTETRMDLIVGRLRRDPHFADRMDELPASVFAVEATTMERFLDGLNEQYGGARSWAMTAGISEKELEALFDLLVEDVTSPRSDAGREETE